MLFKHFYDPGLAQGSYFIGCQKTGEAVVVDARRDVDIYLRFAAANNMTIVAVTETHIHADYLSGSRDLAHTTGATLYLSDEGDSSWKYRFGGTKLYDGDEVKLGNITLAVLHTPGHTPEHLSFLVTDGAAASEPGYYLTGDFVFVGDIGRPDLLDEAAGGVDTRFAGAKQMLGSLRDKFLNLPDYVQVWPAHGAGSACGKALGAVASTTVGYERKFAWWASFLQNNDEEGFISALLDGQPDVPAYFARMKQQNKLGPALLGERLDLEQLTPTAIAERINQEVLFIDTRPAAISGKDAVKGALNVPADKSFVTYASYVIDPEKDRRDIVVLASDETQANDLRNKLSYVGIDNVVGYLTTTKGLARTSIQHVSPSELASLDNPFILDIRTANEYAAGHIPGATQLHAGRVMWNLDSLPKDRPIITHCQSGARNAPVSSALRAAHFNIVELEGSYAAWEKAQATTAA